MPFVDHPLLADFEVPSIAKPKRKYNGGVLFGRDKPALGKPKGVVAKITRDVKQGILNGAIAHGFDGAGEGGLDGYFQMCAAKYPNHYMHLLGKLVPMQLNADGVGGPQITAVNIVSIPTNHFLSAGDIARLKAPALIGQETAAPPPGEVIAESPDVAPEPAPLIGHQDVFEPQTERERRLLAELEALSPEQLLERAKQAGYVDVDSDQTG